MIYRLMLWLGFFVIPVLWTTQHALRASAAAAHFIYLQKTNRISSMTTDPVVIQRNTQKHFLKFGVYIPFEDIISANESEPSEQTLTMQKNCGKGKLYIWVPLRFQFPIIGQRIIEWCLTIKS